MDKSFFIYFLHNKWKKLTNDLVKPFIIHIIIHILVDNKISIYLKTYLSIGRYFLSCGDNWGNFVDKSPFIHKVIMVFGYCG